MKNQYKRISKPNNFKSKKISNPKIIFTKNSKVGKIIADNHIIRSPRYA